MGPVNHIFSAILTAGKASIFAAPFRSRIVEQNGLRISDQLEVNQEGSTFVGFIGLALPQHVDHLLLPLRILSTSPVLHSS
jgi:hypothetical protein